MNPTFKRKVRIEGKPGDASPYSLVVCDADTGEHIKHIKSATIYLDARELNQTVLDYYERDADGSIAVQDEKSVGSHIAVHNPIIDVTAFEKIPTLEELVYTAIGEASMCWSKTPKGTFDSVKAKQIGDNLLEALMNLA